MEYRIVDESDRDVKPGEDGELLVRAEGSDPRKGFFSGYFRETAATEDGWRGGWWHTGDIIRQGPNGSLFFVDRRKNVIRRSGENIAAVEVEEALLRQPVIRNCAVTAVPDDIRGDEVFAFIITAENVAASEQLARQIFEQSLNLLSYFKAPGYVAFVEELPLTASQKISRAEAKILAKKAIDSGRAFDLRAGKYRSRGLHDARRSRESSSLG
jgi:acyl-coenzyme A synthetase/AMP-(fatty) acid ligase